jgi:uncharacterized paraquat-inducible protein A
MMMGFGFLIMLAVLALPILLAAALVIWLMKANSRQGQPRGPLAPSHTMLTSAQRVCSHCGAGLQHGWAHCPQCGAPAD